MNLRFDLCSLAIFTPWRQLLPRSIGLARAEEGRSRVVATTREVRLLRFGERDHAVHLAPASRVAVVERLEGCDAHIGEVPDLFDETATLIDGGDSNHPAVIVRLLHASVEDVVATAEGMADDGGLGRLAVTVAIDVDQLDVHAELEFALGQSLVVERVALGISVVELDLESAHVTELDLAEDFTGLGALDSEFHLSSLRVPHDGCRSRLARNVFPVTQDEV